MRKFLTLSTILLCLSLFFVIGYMWSDIIVPVASELSRDFIVFKILE